MDLTDDDRPPNDLADSLRLIEQERAAAEHDLTPDPRLQLWPWGITYLVGFGAFFLRFGPGGRVFVDLPAWLPLTLLIALIMVTGIVTGFVGAHANRDVRGPSQRQAVMYGISWSATFAGLTVVLSTVNGKLSDPDAGLLWAGTMVAVVGGLHMAAAAVFSDRNLLALGAAISLVNAVGVLLGPGWHALMVGVVGGGGMLVAGLVGWRADQRRAGLPALTGLRRRVRPGPDRRRAVLAGHHDPADGRPGTRHRGFQSRPGRVVRHAAQDEHPLVRARQRPRRDRPRLPVDGR
jgi:hypothetical protein